MIRIRGIDHLLLRVVDLERMLHFYCDVLGCTVERRQDEIGLVQLRAGRSLVDLVPVDGKLCKAGGAAPAKEGRNMDHFCVRVEPFDAAGIRAALICKRKALRSARLPRDTVPKAWGPSIYITDPESNVVDLKGPPAD